MSLYEILTPEMPGDALERLEGGDVILLPHFAVAVEPREQALFSPSILASAKNASFDPASGILSGTTLTGEDAGRLAGLMRRFSDGTTALIATLFPPYAGRVVRGRASFRPAEIAGRRTSWRKDDTRLHVDSFPATPSGGRRILRVFTNVNPAGRPRVWRVGDRFEAVASRFAAGLRMPMPGTARLLALARVTKTRRTPYDALMLQLHDRMKADGDFQTTSPQVEVAFASGTTWLAFTDEVSHAAMSGQYQLEQTFLLPVEAMRHPERSPLRVLERLKRRALV
jgi:3-deoxy-D-manno-oct-2-ulosonic acid (Kdo) hydroxylase